MNTDHYTRVDSSQFFTMTPRQKLAYDNPCYRAQDTVNPRFSAFDALIGRWVSSLLTLNK